MSPGDNTTAQPAFASAFDRGRQASRKREAILDVATMLFNRNGFSATSLEAVASQLSLTKAALYYYVRNKEDLAAQCYERTLALQATNLAAADADGGTGFEKVVAFIRHTMRQANRPSAILTELPALKPEHRDPLAAEGRANARVLRGFITAGAADGSITPCDPKLVSLAIIGSMSWVPQWWRRDGDERLEAVGESFIDLYANGLQPAAAPALVPAQLALPALDPAPGEAFNRAEQARQKRAALLKAATASFNSKGVAATSLEDVVRILNVTKGAFYYYVKSKEDLLYLCFEHSLDLFERVLEQADSGGRSGLEKLDLALRSAILGHCGSQGPFAVFFGQSGVAEARFATLAERARSLNATAMGFLETGIGDGSIRPGNLRHSLLAMTGALAWLPKWYRPGGGHAPDEIGDAFIRLFANGLRPRPRRNTA
ncbi:MAG: TetR family transcriptional regulator [Hyphomicrobiales bacterium]|nr:TetR family transcriptional regulator [Hyphomicrobiales bacterium]MCP5370266.1 TetR family transcriptional regulator [Hyphomicrobiales bacterium]